MLESEISKNTYFKEYLKKRTSANGCFLLSEAKYAFAINSYIS